MRVRGFVLALLLSACAKPETLLDLGTLPSFELVDQRGYTFGNAQLSGKVTIADFIFTSCPDVCPLLTDELVALRKQLPQRAPLALVSFSVDPEHDTPERLQAFAKQHGANRPQWWFVTGPLDEIKAVVTGGFKQAMDLQPTAAGEPRNVLHGTHFVLVDRAGHIRGFYRSDAEGQKALRSAVLSLLPEGTS
jgi:protein SCO1/2